MKRMVLGIIILNFIMVVSAAADNGGTQSPFSFGAGARDLALGGAALATSDPTTAAYWNASQLARVERISLGAFHCRLYDSDVTYQYLGVALPTMDMGGFGLGVFRLGVGGIEKRDDKNLLLGETEDNRLAFYLGYGRSLSGYDFGLALTLEHHSLDKYKTTSSPGLNLSISRRFTLRWNQLPEMVVCVNGRNLLRPGLKLSDENMPDPYTVDAGVSLKLVPHAGWNQDIALSARVTKVDRIDPQIAVGLEYSVGNLLQLRGGVNDVQLSLGGGLRFQSIRFDYALVNRDLGSLHTFSFTFDFGLPLTEKRRLREKRREDQFNDLMKQNLKNRNREMILSLVNQGQQLLQTGDLTQASLIFDRALFLSSSHGLDTVEVSKLTMETKRQLHEITLQQEFKTNLDSAQAKLNAQDYLGANYFANLALAQFPNSPEAQAISDSANTTIEKSKYKGQMIENRLSVIDSLLSYGKVNEALAKIEPLRLMAKEDHRVRLALNKVEFEHWKEKASTAFSISDYTAAEQALDSALSRFPAQPWCLKLRAQIEQALSRPQVATAKVKEETTEKPSQQLLGEVDEAYKNGQKLFKEGKLPQAIFQWEKAERLAPNYMSVRQYLVNAYKFVGVELYGQNRLDEAIEIWKKANKLAPDNLEIESYIRRTENERLKLQELSYEFK